MHICWHSIDIALIGIKSSKKYFILLYFESRIAVVSG